MLSPPTTASPQLSSKTLSLLYRNVLIPWELKLKFASGCWDIRQTRKALEGFDIELLISNAADLPEAAKRLGDDPQMSFFVFTSSSSASSDLFRHIRNSFAHAGISEVLRTKKLTTISFVAQSKDRAATAMLGRIRFELMDVLLEALVVQKP